MLRWCFKIGFQSLSISFVVGAVSPAVVVPSMLLLQENGYGIKKGIPTLLIAASSLDDIIAITGFSACLSIAFSSGKQNTTATSFTAFSGSFKQDFWLSSLLKFIYFYMYRLFVLHRKFILEQGRNFNGLRNHYLIQTLFNNHRFKLIWQHILSFFRSCFFGNFISFQ